MRSLINIRVHLLNTDKSECLLEKCELATLDEDSSSHRIDCRAHDRWGVPVPAVYVSFHSTVNTITTW